MSSTTSCSECRHRHIRCNRGEPCEYCSRLGLDCTYTSNSSGRARRRSRTPSSAFGTRLQALGDTVLQLQQRLADFEQRSETTSNSSGAPSITRIASAQLDLALDAAQSAPGRSTRSLQPFQLWSHYREPIFRQLADVDLTRSLCIDYISNIDPLLKILDHELVADSLVSYPHNSAQGKAVLLSIFFANQACKTPVPLSEYRDSERLLGDALHAANTYTRPSLATVQALTLYLTCGRLNMDQAFLASKLSILVELAMRLHLHRDPAELSYITLDRDHRRRLWWHIVSLDVRTAEAKCSKPIIPTQQIEVEMPSSLEDDHTRSLATSISFALPLCNLCATATIEMVHIARKVLFPSSNQSEPADRKHLSNELHEELSTRYRRHCRDSDPPVCRLIMDWCLVYWERQKLLLVHLEQAFLRNVSHVDSNNISADLKSCVSIMKRIQDLRANAALSQWAWLWQNCVEWDIGAVTLCLIATSKCGSDLAQQALSAVDTTFAAWNGDFGDAAHRRRWKELTTFRDWVKATQSMEPDST